MSRKPIIRSNTHYYHLTGRSNNKENFFLPTEEVWVMMLQRLRLLQVEYDFRISAFVLMDNHFHLLALTPQEPIDRIMYFFMKDVTKDMHKRTGRINRVFGGRYKGCLIENERYLLNAYKYICRNPVAANLCERAEDYRFSTLNCAIKNIKIPIVLESVAPMNISVSRKVELDWINSAFKVEEAESVRWGLSRTCFQYKKASRKVEIAPALWFPQT